MKSLVASFTLALILIIVLTNTVIVDAFLTSRAYYPSSQHLCSSVVDKRISSTTTTTTTLFNVFDDLKLIFSEEGKKNRAAFKNREKDEMAAAQMELLERRRNPEKMAEYEAAKLANRKKLEDERNVYTFQNKVGEKGYDPLNEWKRLRAEGKIQLGKDLKRDEGSSRLGSEGLFDVRVDERMPYIDQGYVDESADVMGNFMNLFGGGKKKKKKDDGNE